MAITRKEFVLNVVEEMKKNPRAVLAGHGIQAVVLQTIVGRMDVMSKLATVLYSTVYAKKGALGMKKAANLKISGYKNFADFNLKAREDVETFIAGLSPEDAASFTNADNILTILLLPDAPSTGEESTTEQIVSGKSVALTFDSAVRKEYKIAGGMYVTVMLGGSVARPAEEAIATRTQKANKVKQVRRTPAKIIAELKAKANKKLNILKAKKKELDETAFGLTNELAQFNRVAAAEGPFTMDPDNLRAYRKENQGAIRRLNSANEQYLLDLALATDEKKKLSIRSMISKNNTKIRQYRAKLGTYKRISAVGIKKKAEVLAQTHALIEANIAKGASISQALNNALASIGLKPEQQQIIKQQVMQQVAGGTPMQYAVQQAVQANYQTPVAVEESFADTNLSSNMDIEDILNTL